MDAMQGRVAIGFFSPIYKLFLNTFWQLKSELKTSAVDKLFLSVNIFRLTLILSLSFAQRNFVCCVISLAFVAKTKTILV